MWQEITDIRGRGKRVSETGLVDELENTQTFCKLVARVDRLSSWKVTGPLLHLSLWPHCLCT